MKELKKKQSTKALVKALRKAARERKEKIWLDLAERISKPSRHSRGVNLEKISKIAAKSKGKVIVVPGKVLGKGNLSETAEVGALAFSESARAKISGKGKALTFTELLASKRKAGEMVIAL